MKKQEYQGSCHCGAIKYTVQMTLENTITCNCSMCKRAGWILAFVPHTDFELTSGEDMLTNYQFNKKKIDHLFCSVCGIKSFGRGSDDAGNEMIAINIRCLADVDIAGLQPVEYDGAAV